MYFPTANLKTYIALCPMEASIEDMSKYRAQY